MKHLLFVVAFIVILGNLTSAYPVNDDAELPSPLKRNRRSPDPQIKASGSLTSGKGAVSLSAADHSIYESGPHSFGAYGSYSQTFGSGYSPPKIGGGLSYTFHF